MKLGNFHQYDDLSSHLVEIAGSIRSSLDPKSGVIDIRSCLDAASEIESCSQIVLKIISDINKNIEFKEIFIEASRYNTSSIKSLLGLRNYASALILGELISRPGYIISREYLAEISGCKQSSINVYICHIRNDLKKFGIEDSIKCNYSSGYFVTSDAYEKINQIISGAQNQ